MGQTKKSLYDLYPMLRDTLANAIRKDSPKAHRKMSTSSAIKFLLDSMPRLLHTLDFFIVAEEYYWEKKGTNVIFPESGVVLDNFYRAKFQLEMSAGFSLPFDSFMLAMPNGYRCDGTLMPGIMVQFYDYHRAGEELINPFCDAIKIDRPVDIKREEVPLGTRAIVISYRDPKNASGYARALIPDFKIPEILKAQDRYEFQRIMGHYKNQVGVVELEDHDLDIQFKAIKLVAALGVYHLATEGERLRDGFPGQVLPKMNNRSPDMRIRMSTLSSSAPSQLHFSPSTHYRTWYIRQLRDPKYYKGRYESSPIGSRFVFVSDAVVGAKIEPSTLT